MRLSVGAVFALIFCNGAAQAGEVPLYAPAPDWVTPAPEPDMAKMTDATPLLVILDHQQRMKGDEGWAYIDMATRAVSPQMLTELGTVQLPWNPDHGDLIVHRAQIMRGAERIDLLADPARRFTVLRREQQLEQRQLNGQLTATLAVEGLRVGDILRVTFSVSMTDKALGGQIQNGMPLPSVPMPVKFGRYRLIWPEDAPIRWRADVPKATAVRESRNGGYREISIDLPLEKPVEMPGDSPFRFRIGPMVEATSFADWQDVSRRMAPLYQHKGLIAPGSPLAEQVAAIAAASTDPRARTAAALQLVQDKIRYLFVSLQGGNYVPQKPADTWSLRYGDCKAKTLLLLAILHELGVEAEAVLVSSKLGDAVPQRLPMPGVFDHVIVRATIDGQSYWLDGTGMGSRPVDLADTPPFRNVLPLRAAGAGLMPLPMHRNARPDGGVDVEMDMSAGLHFPAPYRLRMSMRGQLAEMMRIVATQATKDQLNEAVDKIATEYLGVNEPTERSVQYDEKSGRATVSASGIYYPDWNEEAGRFKLSVDRLVKDYSFAPDRSRAEWQDIPVGAGSGGDVIQRTRITLPPGEGFTLEGNQSLPEWVAGTRTDRKASLSNGLLTIEERFSDGLKEIAAADIPAAREQVAQVAARALTVLSPAGYPTRVGAVLAARKGKMLAPIRAVYDRQVAAAPREVESFTDRAWFHEQLFEYRAALSDMDKAIALAATPENYRRRAGLYQLLGQDAQALVDARAALKLEPGSQPAILLAAHLEAVLGDTAKALAMVEPGIAAGGKEKQAYVEAKADILAYSGKAAEGIALLDAELSRSPGNPSLLNNRCWIKGSRNVAVDTALKDCTKAIELADDTAQILDSRALAYFRLGRMEDALADVNAALEQSPGLANSLFLRGILHKRAGDAAAAEADLLAARTVDPTIEGDYAKYGIAP